MGLIFKEISGYVYDSISVDRLVVFCMKIRVSFIKIFTTIIHFIWHPSTRLEEKDLHHW